MKFQHFVTTIAASIGLFIASTFSSDPANANISEAYQLASIQKKILEQSGWNARAETVDYMREGYYIDYTATLYSGNQYAFMVHGDRNARDMDIAVYDKYGRKLVEDISSKAYGLAFTNTVSYTQDVTIRVTMHKVWSNSGGHFALSLGYR